MTWLIVLSLVPLRAGALPARSFRSGPLAWDAPGGARHAGPTGADADDDETIRLAVQFLDAGMEGSAHALTRGVQNYASVGFYSNNGTLADLAAYGAIPKTIDDLKLVLGFARTFGLTVTAKVNGHSFSGGSGITADPDKSIVVWMRDFDSVQVHPGQVTDACGRTHPHGTYTVGGGASFSALYSKLGKNHSSLGGHGSLGAGWLLGNGMSDVQQRAHGLGIDNVVSFDVMVGSGEVLTVSACSHPFLFRALRGGGGGFAIVLSATLPLLPATPVQMWFFRVARGEPPNGIDETLDWWKLVVKWAIAADRRWSMAGQPQLRHMGPFQMRLTYMGDKAEAEADPLFQDFLALYRTMPPEHSQLEHRNWSTFHRFKAETQPPGYNESRDYRNPTGQATPYKGNWYIPQSFVAEHPTEAAHLLHSIDGLACDNLYHLGGRIQEMADQAAGSVANANLRTAAFQIGLCDQAMLEHLKELFPPAAGGGIGLNHLGWHQKNVVAAVWGKSNYEYMLGVKRKYDPESVFGCRHCVGWPDHLSELHSGEA